MKNLFKTFLLVVVLGTHTGYAKETLVTPSKVNNVKKGNHISVTDASGQTIYSGRINYDGNISKLYDFTQLENGIYTVEVNKDFVIEIATLQVKDHAVTFIKETKEKIFKPVFRSENSTIMISKLALDTDKMEVELYFKDELIYSETVKGNEILNRVYKLDETIKGDYTAIIKSNERVFIKNFKI